jgi:ATP-dependent Clp protease ATP-binding subunit ClpA
VMDHATLTDNNGRQSDFRHVVLIFTTNAGARDMTAVRVGFGAGARSFMVSGTKLGEKVASFDLDSGAGGDAKKAIERTFSPEFRNRMDGWIAFSSLPMEVVEQIVDKQLDELRVQLKEKNVELELLPEARKWLADHGFSPQFGARPMARLIQTALKKPLAERILFGDLEKGGKVVLGVQDDRLSIGKE